jgi:hypothetical protein
VDDGSNSIENAYRARVASGSSRNLAPFYAFHDRDVVQRASLAVNKNPTLSSRFSKRSRSAPE